MPEKQVAKQIEKDLSIAYDRMEEMTYELGQDEIIDFGIEIIECEYKDSCLKYSEFCFNEYKDVCSTRSVLTLSKNLRETE